MKGSRLVQVVCDNHYFGSIEPWEVNEECDYWQELGYTVDIDEEDRVILITSN